MEMTGSRLRLAFLLTALILAVEVLSGWVAGSLALLADAGHVLTDVIALGLAWFAVEQAKRPSDSARTYGYHRVGILAAMVNGASLIVIVAWIAYEAVGRLQHPRPVSGGLVVAAALVAIGLNAFIGFSLRGSRNLNVRAALLHVLGDLAASIGVVAAGVVILLTNWTYADPLVSLGIAVLVAWGALRLVGQTVNILLEGTPRSVDLKAVRSAIAGTAGVSSVHDLHVWALSAEELALSCHVVVPEDVQLAAGEHLVRDLELRLCADFAIAHTTIQVEACHPCPGEDMHTPGAHNHPHAVRPA
ncbi:MAG TPA: cation diffusion facilitator family transporter [Candidatus Acidoferrales bacterium]|nr:cation diffusion facilitator family transporter [Candidatus Acidoferrales bacterium]